MLLLDPLHRLSLGSQQSHQSSLTCGALNNTATLSTGTCQELLGQVNHLAQPIQHDHLQFSACRAGNPGESDAGNGTAQHVSYDCWVAVCGGEVGVELGAMPVSDTGHDDSLYVSHNVLPVVWADRGYVRDQWAEVTWLDFWEDAPMGGWIDW